MKINIFRKTEILTPEQIKERRNDRLLLALSGIMMGLSFPPVPSPVLMFFGLIPYFHVIEKKKTLLDVNRATYLMSFFFTLVATYWVGAWQIARDPFLMIGGGLLMFINPLFFMIASMLLHFARKVFNNTVALFLFPLFWVTYEYAYMLTDASFPWLTLGNGLSHFNTFIQIADVIGAMGLSVIVVFINLFLYKGITAYKINRKKSYLFAAGALLLIILPVIYGVVRINSFRMSDEKVKIGIVQPDLDPYDKWSGSTMNGLTNEYLSLSKKAIAGGAEVIVWPETAFPVYLFCGSYPGTVGKIYDFIKENNVQLLTGMPHLVYYNERDSLPPDVKINKTGTFRFATYNAVILADPYTFQIQTYGKMKLVPFGERVPFVDKIPFVGKLFTWGVGISGWNVGRDTTVFDMCVYSPIPKKNDSSFLLPSIPQKKLSFKVNGCVCYESVYPDFIARFTQKGSQLIALVTNDSWYGNSGGPYQHKEISVLRAVENRRSVIRAANGGISCYINPLGITEQATEMFTKDALVTNVVLQSEMTFFARFPLIIPVSSSIISLWIIGLYYLIKLKTRFSKRQIV